MLESRLFAKQFANREHDPRVQEFILAKTKDFPIDESDKKRLLFHFFNEDALNHFKECMGDIIILESNSKWQGDTTVTNKNYMDKQTKKYNGETPTYSF